MLRDNGSYTNELYVVIQNSKIRRIGVNPT